MPEINEHNVEELWSQFPGHEYYTEAENEQMIGMLTEAIDISVNEHERLDTNPLFEAFLDELGMDMDDFPWEAFQEWLEDLYSET